MASEPPAYTYHQPLDQPDQISYVKFGGTLIDSNPTRTSGGSLPIWNKATSSVHEDNKRVCGLPRWVFGLAIGATFLVVGVIAAAFIVRASHFLNGSSIGAMAVVADTAPLNDDLANSNATTYFFQNMDSREIFMINRNWPEKYEDPNEWKQMGRLTGLDPSPKAGSPIAAVRAPGEDSISIYYVAENGTLYDAIGSPGNTTWRMGNLAPQTSYKIVASDDSGIAATWWGRKDDFGPGYRRRVYYVEKGADMIRELSFEANRTTQWLVSQQPSIQCSKKAKIAVAHLPATNDSYERETAHLFFEDRNEKVRHFPGYNGDWDEENSYAVQDRSLPGSANIAATIHVNERLDHPLSLWYIDRGSKLLVLTGKGQSPKVKADFESKVAYDSAWTMTQNRLEKGKIMGGYIAGIGWSKPQSDEAGLRVYYLAADDMDRDKNSVIEFRRVGVSSSQQTVRKVET